MMNSKEIQESLNTKGLPFRLDIDGVNFAFEKRLYKKIQLMCERITKHTKDAFLINEGYEGDGKTNSSLVESVVAYSLLKKKFKKTSIHLFFKTSSCIDFAKKEDHKIIILDEPSFESLSSDAVSRLNKDFLRLISTMRKKGHYFILNCTKFWKFPVTSTLMTSGTLNHSLPVAKTAAISVEPIPVAKAPKAP